MIRLLLLTKTRILKLNCFKLKIISLYTENYKKNVIFDCSFFQFFQETFFPFLYSDNNALTLSLVSSKIEAICEETIN